MGSWLPLPGKFQAAFRFQPHSLPLLGSNICFLREVSEFWSWRCANPLIQRSPIHPWWRHYARRRTRSLACHRHDPVYPRRVTLHHVGCWSIWDSLVAMEQLQISDKNDSIYDILQPMKRKFKSLPGQGASKRRSECDGTWKDMPFCLVAWVSACHSVSVSLSPSKTFIFNIV